MEPVGEELRAVLYHEPRLDEEAIVLRYIGDRPFFIATVSGYGRVTLNAHNRFEKVLPAWVGKTVVRQYPKFFEVIGSTEPDAKPREHPVVIPEEPVTPQPEPVTVPQRAVLPLQRLAQEIIKKDARKRERDFVAKARDTRTLESRQHMREEFKRRVVETNSQLD